MAPIPAARSTSLTSPCSFDAFKIPNPTAPKAATLADNSSRSAVAPCGSSRVAYALVDTASIRPTVNHNGASHTSAATTHTSNGTTCQGAVNPATTPATPPATA